jgi:succinate-acetate transporter protein
MTALDANADGTPQPEVQTEETEEVVVAEVAVTGPLAGNPAILGLPTFIAGSVALGLGLAGVVPAGVLGAPLAIILAATALGLLLAAIWAAAVGQSAVASVFGIFGTFWLSYGVLVLGLDHNWFAITVTAVLATVKLFLLTWLIVIVMLTLATLRLPVAFTAVFVLVDLALLLLYLAFANASPLGVPSSGLIKTAGYVVLVFAAVGVYLFFDAASVATGGKSLPLGKPLLHG